MGQEQECTLCGIVYVDSATHYRFHKEIDAWIELIDLALTDDLPIRPSRGAQFGP